MKVISIASGSKGNAYLVEEDGEALLIDCGVCYKKLKNIEFSAVLVTHSHTDHVSGISALLKKRDIPVFANAMTAETIIHECGVSEDAFVCFENGQSFDLGRFTVSPFSIPHDTSDPVGFLVRTAECTYFHGTDIGTPLDSIGLKFAEADIATIESNHDTVLLCKSGRHPSLIRRIAGPRGHLSNDEACELVRRFASTNLRKLALAHLSRDCNVPHIAYDTMKATLQEMDRPDIDLKVLCQDEVVEL